jgi:hypothetical protein
VSTLGPPRYRIEHHGSDRAPEILAVVETIDDVVDLLDGLLPDLAAANAGGTIHVVAEHATQERTVITRMVAR